MTPVTDKVAQMLAEGAPVSAILAVVYTLELVTLRHVTVTSLVTSPSRSPERIKANIRATRYRLAKRNQQLAKANDVASPTVTVTSPSVTSDVTQSQNVHLLTSFLSTSLLPEETLKKERKKVFPESDARARGNRMEPGTPLSDKFREIILAEGIPDPDQFWAEFVDYWSEIPGQRGCKISWIGTVRNRCRQVKTGFNGAKNGSSQNKTGVVAAAKRLAERFESESRDRSAGYPTNLFRLPPR